MVFWVISQLGKRPSHIHDWSSSDSSVATKFLASKTPPAAPANVPGVPTVDPFSLPPASVSLGWPLGQQLAMHVHLSTSPNGDVFSRKWTSGWRHDQDAGLPSFVWENITFGDYKDSRVVEYNVNFPDVRLPARQMADTYLMRTPSVRPA